MFQSTIDALLNDTISVEDVKAITSVPCNQNNFEEIVHVVCTTESGVHSSALNIFEKLHDITERLQVFEQERSQLLALTRRFQVHFQGEAKSKF